MSRGGESRWEASVSIQAGADHVPSDGDSRGMERKGSAKGLVYHKFLSHRNRLDMGADGGRSKKMPPAVALNVYENGVPFH